MSLMSKYLDDMKNKSEKTTEGMVNFTKRKANEKMLKSYRNENGLIIDFYQFAFLVEACIPPRPIARTSFWHDVVEHYYHILTWWERGRLFEWITKNTFFDRTNEDCLLFYNRFDPDNQYWVGTLFQGKAEIHHCFYMDGRYYTSKTTSIQEEYIKKVTKMEVKDE